MSDSDRPSWQHSLSAGDGVTGWIEETTLWLVAHNRGRGSAKLPVTVTSRAAAELTARTGQAELVFQGELPQRFQAVVVDADPGLVMLSVVGPAGPPVRVRYRAGPDQFEDRARGDRGPWPAATLLVTEERIANRLNEAWFQPLELPPGAPGHWLLDAGSLDDFVADLEARVALAAQRSQQHRERLRERDRQQRQDSHFINPYTFVPLPACGPARSAPPGHDRCDSARPLVRIDLTWEARTPLATRDRYDTGDGRSGLAGSAVKGAIRAFHEALTGSCLRVVDLDAAPGHREPTHAGRGRRLARVHHVTDPAAGGREITLQLARQTVWAPSDALPLPLASGTPCDMSGVRGRIEPVLGRDQVVPDEAAGPAFPSDPEMDWVPLLSDIGARAAGRRYFVALGWFARVAREPDLVRFSTADPVWRRYESAAAGSDDERRRKDGPVDLTVCWDERVIGTRQEVRYAMDGPAAVVPGQLLWVTLDAGGVSSLAAAYLWRRGAAQTVRHRLPDSFLPCTDPGRLCPSCQLFGSGGEPGSTGDGGEAAAAGAARDAGGGYRGHVRFGPMVTDVPPDGLTLAPLNAPGISAGQFYLEQPDREQAGRDEIPLREWGSAADATGLRRLRGRKFYWPADPAVQQEIRQFPHPRWRIEQAPYGQLRSRGQNADVWPAGTTFTETMTLVGLDREQLGGLLAALRPDLLAGPAGDGWSRAVVRMGYGKPFGLGVLRLRELVVTSQAPADRYGPEPKPPRTVPADELAEWVAAFVAATGEEVRATWPDLQAVTDPDHVWPEFVTYPVDRWEDYPTGSRPGGDDYQFGFWRRSVGDHHHRLVALPVARSPDQLLPLRPEQEGR